MVDFENLPETIKKLETSRFDEREIEVLKIALAGYINLGREISTTIVTLNDVVSNNGVIIFDLFDIGMHLILAKIRKGSTWLGREKFEYVSFYRSKILHGDPFVEGPKWKYWFQALGMPETIYRTDLRFDGRS